jgi:hypothetical protein
MCNVIPINVGEEEAHMFAQTLSCKLGNFSLQYLGVSLHHSKLRKEDLKPIIDKVMKKASRCRVRMAMGRVWAG